MNTRSRAGICARLGKYRCMADSGIAQSATTGEDVRLSPALFQPIASDDVVAALADLALAPPVNGTVEVAGPQPIPLDEAVRSFFQATGVVQRSGRVVDGAWPDDH